MLTIHHGHNRDDHGQILVIVGVAMLVLIGMVGLVLDGGSAYAQRRSQQNASDLAALAGANAYLLTNDTGAAQSAALAVAKDNGWEHGTDEIVVTVTTVGSSNGAQVTVDVDAPHHNAFGSVLGLMTFDVGTTATAVSGFPDTAEGAAPMIFNEGVFGTDGLALAQYSNPLAPFATFNGRNLSIAPSEGGPDGSSLGPTWAGNLSNHVTDIIPATTSSTCRRGLDTSPANPNCRGRARGPHRRSRASISDRRISSSPVVHDNAAVQRLGDDPVCPRSLDGPMADHRNFTVAVPGRVKLRRGVLQDLQ